MVHAFHCYQNLSAPECESNKTLNDMFLPFISSPSNPHLFLLFFFLFGRTEFFPKKIKVGLEVRIPSSPSSFLAADFPGTQMLSPKTFPNGDSIRQASRLVNLHFRNSPTFSLRPLGRTGPDLQAVLAALFAEVIQGVNIFGIGFNGPGPSMPRDATGDLSHIFPTV